MNSLAASLGREVALEKRAFGSDKLVSSTPNQVGSPPGANNPMMHPQQPQAPQPQPQAPQPQAPQQQAPPPQAPQPQAQPTANPTELGQEAAAAPTSGWDVAETVGGFAPMLGNRFGLVPGAIAAGRKAITGEGPSGERWDPGVGEAIGGAITAATPAGAAIGGVNNAADWYARGVPTKKQITGTSGRGINSQDPNSYIGKYGIRPGMSFTEKATRIGGALSHPLDGMKNVYHQFRDALNW